MSYRFVSLPRAAHGMQLAHAARPQTIKKTMKIFTDSTDEITAADYRKKFRAIDKCHVVSKLFIRILVIEIKEINSS